LKERLKTAYQTKNNYGYRNTFGHVTCTMADSNQPEIFIILQSFINKKQTRLWHKEYCLMFRLRLYKLHAYTHTVCVCVCVITTVQANIILLKKSYFVKENWACSLRFRRDSKLSLHFIILNLVLSNTCIVINCVIVYVPTQNTHKPNASEITKANTLQ
jgi:hypothetical protein